MDVTDLLSSLYATIDYVAYKIRELDITEHSKDRTLPDTATGISRQNPDTEFQIYII
jgi:hypothetical protein